MRKQMPVKRGQSQTTSKMSQNHLLNTEVVQRTAINPTGRIGAFYDIHRDQISCISPGDIAEEQRIKFTFLDCKLIHGNADENINILRKIGVEDELRLSLLMKLTKRNGIAAVLNHPHVFDQYTRVLHYSWMHHTAEMKDIVRLKRPPANRTHIITNVKYGIHLLAVLQISLKIETVHTIDDILNKLRDALSRDITDISALNCGEIDLLDKSISTVVYSNDKRLSGLSNILGLLREINNIKQTRHEWFPVIYSLQPIKSLYDERSLGDVRYVPLSNELIDNLEQYILHIRNPITRMETLYNKQTEGQQEFEELKKRLIKWLTSSSKLVVNARRGSEICSKKIEKILQDSELKLLRANVNRLNNYINDLDVPRQSSKHSSDLHKHLNEQPSSSIAKKKNNDYDNNREPEINSSYDLSQTNSRQSSSAFTTTIVDKRDLSTKQQPFSPTDNSRSLIISSLEPSTQHDNTLEDRTASPINYTEISPKSVSPENEITTILLLGESGVGKSTFINALANYLTFDSFDEAETSEPAVLIPVSFVTTVGDNFEERIVKFGEVDSYNNEDFDHPGQSVTQHCKSYLFDLKYDHGKQLRIIDTPGFGDTRGLDQDEQNMEHILQYINNLTHINAICFLLKPNTSRLHIILRTCFNQLFSFLHSDARQNLIFCFTNARSTFYTPGDTAPLLKTMLKSLSINNLSFTKTNTFCFDNEAFRLLVSLQNDISFDEDSKREYETSWLKSVLESNRLIQYINPHLPIYHMKNKWPSMKQAQFEILYMVRPVLEAMRNILRNIILIKMNRSNESIELYPESLHGTTTRCLSCKPDLVKVAHFWIIPDTPHDIQTNCLTCRCPIKQHVSIDYIIRYQCQHRTAKDQTINTWEVLHRLYSASANLALFLESTDYCTKGDPFLDGLIKMIADETDISNTRKQEENHFNSQLVEELRKLENQYTQQLNQIKSTSKTIDIKTIYELIQFIREYPLVQEQMVAVKNTHRMIMKNYEHEVQMI